MANAELVPVAMPTVESTFANSRLPVGDRRQESEPSRDADILPAPGVLDPWFRHRLSESRNPGAFPG